MRVLLLTGMYPHSQSRSDGIAIARQHASLLALGVDMDLLHTRPHGRWQWLRTLFALRRVVASGQYDLVHAHFGFRTTLLAVSQSLPLVITYHGSDLNGYPFSTWRKAHYSFLASAASRVTRQLARAADAVIVMTEEMKGRLPATVQAQTWVEPMGVDTRLFHQHSQAEARGQLGWGREPVVVFCDHGGKSVKRQELAEQTLAEARRQRPDLRLFILRGVEPHKVPLVLSAANCLLVTSAREGSPNVVRESLACNLPVVSVPVGDVPALLARAADAGCIVPREPRLLANAVVDVIQRPRPQLEHLMRDHSLEATGRRIIQIYEKVLHEHGKVSVAARRNDAYTGDLVTR